MVPAPPLNRYSRFNPAGWLSSRTGLHHTLTVATTGHEIEEVSMFTQLSDGRKALAFYGLALGLAIANTALAPILGAGVLLSGMFTTAAGRCADAAGGDA